jgi:26S proteasome regulatory subunit N8
MPSARITATLTSPAVPFEEDPKNPSVWFLDHDFLESMFAMFRKVNAREKVVGWYHTGPKLAKNDIHINEVIRRFVPHPILIVIDAKPKEVGLPTRAYVAVEEVHDDGTPSVNTFNHVSSEIGAEEAEEVGVEHLLRDIKDIGDLGTLTHRIQFQLASLKGLVQNLREVSDYLALVESGKLPVNHQIIYALQDTFNLLPNLASDEFVRSLSIKTNDQMLAVYLATLVRSTIALHNLINNKLELL